VRIQPLLLMSLTGRVPVSSRFEIRGGSEPSACPNCGQTTEAKNDKQAGGSRSPRIDPADADTVEISPEAEIRLLGELSKEIRDRDIEEKEKANETAGPYGGKSFVVAERGVRGKSKRPIGTLFDAVA